MTYLQLFYRFLKQNHIYHLFLYNVKNRKHVECDYDIKLMKTYKAYTFIYSAFKWDDTREGFDFWDNINIKWRDILRNKLSLYTSSKIRGNDKIISPNEFINLIN